MPGSGSSGVLKSHYRTVIAMPGECCFLGMIHSSGTSGLGMCGVGWDKGTRGRARVGNVHLSSLAVCSGLSCTESSILCYTDFSVTMGTPFGDSMGIGWGSGWSRVRVSFFESSTI